VGAVGLFEETALFFRELHVEGGDGVIQVLHLRGADDGSGDAGLVKKPRESDLRGGQAAAAGY
jgi:hypothetical protein